MQTPIVRWTEARTTIPRYNRIHRMLGDAWQAGTEAQKLDANGYYSNNSFLSPSPFRQYLSAMECVVNLMSARHPFLPSQEK